MSRRLHRAGSRASLALVVPVAGFGGLMVALSIATGSARRIVERLPLPEPGPNGFPLAVLLVIGVGAWLRMARAITTPHEPAELAGRDNEKWPLIPMEQRGHPAPLADPGSPWFGTAPFTEAPPVRRLYPVIPAEDLAMDPEQLKPTLLPVRPERRVRS